MFVDIDTRQHSHQMSIPDFPIIFQLELNKHQHIFTLHFTFTLLLLSFLSSSISREKATQILSVDVNMVSGNFSFERFILTWPGLVLSN